MRTAPDSKEISFFDRFFPVPKLLSCSGPGIEISEDTIRVIKQTGVNGCGKAIYQEKEIPAGIVSAGAVLDVKKLTEEISSLGLPPSIIRLAIPDEKVFLFDITIPRKDVQNPDDAILFRLEENVPIPTDEALFEWRTVATREAPEGEMVTFSVTVLPQQTLASFIEAVEAAGHRVVECVPKTFSIAHAVGFSDMRPWVLLHVGKYKSNIAVVTGRTVRYSSVVPFGMTQAVEAIARETKKAVTEIETELYSRGVVGFEQDELSFETLKNAFAGLRDEISKVVVFWNNQNTRSVDSAYVEHALVTGVGVALPGVLDLLTSGTPLSYSLAEPWKHMCGESTIVPAFPRNESLVAVASIGLLSSN